MSPAFDRLLSALESQGLGPKQNGSGWVSRCPSHDDARPSLTINQGEDGRALVRCHAGCSFEQILASLGMGPADAFEVRETPSRETRFAIRDTAGSLVAVHVRQDRARGKSMWWERNGRRGLGGLRLADLPLYLSETVPAVPPDAVVVVVEGEKAADTLREHGQHVLGTATGAASCPGRASLAVLAGRDVVLWPDADAPGLRHMQRVAPALTAVARTLRVFVWVDAPDHGDAHDYFASGKTADDLRVELASAVDAAEWQAATHRNGGETSSAPIQSRESARRVGRLEPQGSGLGLTDDDPAEDTVDGAKMLSEVSDTLRRFAVLSKHAMVAVALWVVLTFLTDHVDLLPRLLLCSPTKACGKTRLLTVVAALVRRAMAASSVTPAAIFRAVEAGRPTLLLDEMDNARLKENDELRAILNSGYTPGGAYVLRTVGDGHEVRRFSTWAAIAFAGIGRLSDTIESRCVRVPMTRKMRSERVERLREARLKCQFEPLRRRIARWCLDNATSIGEADPQVPDALGDRDADNWRPLLAIADMAGGDWPRLAREAALELSGVADEDTPGVLLLADFQDYFETRGTDRVTTKDILAHLSGLETRPWPEWSNGKPVTDRAIARLLSPFKIEPRSLRDEHDRVVRGYFRDDFAETWKRYAPSGPGLGRNNATDRDSSGPSVTFGPQQAPPCSGRENGLPPNNDGARSTVADGDRTRDSMPTGDSEAAAESAFERACDDVDEVLRERRR